MKGKFILTIILIILITITGCAAHNGVMETEEEIIEALDNGNQVRIYISK